MTRRSIIAFPLLLAVLGIAAFCRGGGKGKKGTAAPVELPTAASVELPAAVEAALESDECDDSSFVEQFLPDARWESYQLTDFFKGRGGVTPENYPGSLMDEYHSTGRGAEDLDLLYDLVSRRKEAFEDGVLPGPGTLVVHLRLGDVVSGSFDSVRAMLSEQKYYYRQNAAEECCDEPWKHPENPPLVVDWNAYERPLSYYSGVLEDLPEHRSVVVMGSAHMGQLPSDAGLREAATSCQYAAAIKAYLAWKLPTANVTFRLGRHPDEDVVFASQAATYLQAGGGFSGLIGQLVAKFGGTVLNEVEHHNTTHH